MIVPFTETGFGPAPFLEVRIASAEFRVMALVDSGSANTLFPFWVAELASLDLKDARNQHLGLGGQVLEASFIEVEISAGNLVWEAEVGFCKDWSSGWGVLGRSSFFRYFTVTFRVADGVFELVPQSE